jgi:predicted nucleotidyltransferase
MEMSFGLKEETVEKIKKIFQLEPKIHEAVIFGSRAKGNFKNGSDIDLALKGGNLSHDDILKMYNLLDELNLPYTFDLLIFSQIKDKEVIEHINRAGKSFYLANEVTT